MLLSFTNDFQISIAKKVLIVITLSLAFLTIASLTGCNKKENEDIITLVSDEETTTIYIDPEGDDYDGIKLATKAFAKDIQLITGQSPQILTQISEIQTGQGTIVIAGSIGNNRIIDQLIDEEKIDVTDIEGKWESYKIQVLDNPTDDLDKAIVIVGSDKRGSIYGIYHISELMGVSPWVYWGDVLPKKQESINFTRDELDFTSKEPSVKYRGIFLNDEWPSLGNWTSSEFGGFNEDFYDQVFELILRLKGNYLWPAMWSSSFSEDGQSSPIANAEHAHAYGIVMGNSHHEPMIRAGVEWQRVYSEYGPDNTWDFSINTEAITNFWNDGLIRNKEYENVITIGMRGEADSALVGSAKENIQLLKDIIITQKELLRKNNLSDAPQALTLYKEVEDYWHGTNSVEGLNNWDLLNDVIIVLAEDNFGNVRSLPSEDERDRPAGWGMYYHFDYHGAPISYEWVNTVPLAKIWEQMSMTYDYGVQDLWVVNVGDLKPMELPISYFLDLAYDFDTWGTNGINKTEEYTRNWVKQQYGSALDETSIHEIAEILTAYTKMNGSRKPETTYTDTYSISNFNEAQRVLKEALQIQEMADKYLEIIPEEYKDSYYQLVYYPAVASANVKNMHIYASLNEFYYKEKSLLANSYARLVEESINTDRQMEYYYNTTMSEGKWSGMMSSEHIAYKSWDGNGQYPSPLYIVPESDSIMIISLENSHDSYKSGIGTLPTFTNLGKEAYWMTISNGGMEPFDFAISSSDDWIKVSNDKGTISTGDLIEVWVDWDKLDQTSEGVITIDGASDQVKVSIKAELINTSDFEEMTFVESHNLVSIEAQHFSNKLSKSGVDYKVIDKLGRSLSSVKMFPTDVSFEKAQDAPYLEYKIYVNEDALYTLTAYTAPTNNMEKLSRLRYAVSFGNEEPTIKDSLHPEFIAGDHMNWHWSDGVLNNIRTSTTNHELTKGVHTLRFYGIDAGLVLQKLVLSKEPLPKSYFGPEESYYVGKEVKEEGAVCHNPESYMTLLGTIPADDISQDENSYFTSGIVPVADRYHVTLEGIATEDSHIRVKVGITSYNLEWKAGETSVKTHEPFRIGLGVQDITITVVSGDVNIENIILLP